MNELEKKALEYLQKGENFLSEEAPLYVTELLNWKLGENIVLLVVSLLVFISAIFVGKKTYNYTNNENYPKEFFVVIGGIYAVAAGLGGFLGLINHILIILQIVIAPRVYLVEYLMRMSS